MIHQVSGFIGSRDTGTRNPSPAAPRTCIEQSKYGGCSMRMDWQSELYWTLF